MNLVIQGPSLTETGVQEVARLVGKPPERIGEKAFRFRNSEPSAAIASWSEKNQVDHAFIPEGRRFEDLRLLAMDMDSTLITIECIDELGALAGKKAEVAAVTAQAMRGEIDYPESLRRRVRAIAGLSESALSDVYENRLKLTAGADILIEACKRNGVRLLLVSGGFTFFTERLKARLGIDDTISNTLEVRDGKLTGALLGDIVGAEAKARKFLEVMKSVKAKKEQTVAIGDGANDLKMMAEAGYSVAFRAKPVVRAQASCAITWCGLEAVVNLFEG